MTDSSGTDSPKMPDASEVDGAIQRHLHAMVELSPPQLLEYFYQVFFQSPPGIEDNPWIMSMRIQLRPFHTTPPGLQPLLTLGDFQQTLPHHLASTAIQVMYPDSRPDTLTLAQLKQVTALVDPIVEGLHKVVTAGIGVYLQIHPIMTDPSTDLSDVEDFQELLTRVWLRIPGNGHWMRALYLPTSRDAAAALLERRALSDSALH